MRRRTFKITFETWDESGETTETFHKEYDVGDDDLANVEGQLAELFAARTELGKKKLNPE